jgi:hypothetical protein
VRTGLTCLWLCGPVLAACATEPAPAAAGATDTLAGVQALIGQAACRTDTDCRTVAVGHKACGGPLAYLPWSVAVTDSAALAQAVARYNAAQQAAQAAGGLLSNCQFVGDPGATCRAAAGGGLRCQLRSAPDRAGPTSR